ncbi:DUF3007 family protein [Iningainema tapete]|uniref:DUF3007 family protein n=1 Tax=Iningainema tapete BLCC-T55 TaxID=2748662 RepID=A0A8J6XRM2_9CYAN|nr:DUF3007 family protein [Iningainema tapete]MBD2778317.1 DUF3007 family protein [Iningainema tapete BLCC-T55]
MRRIDALGIGFGVFVTGGLAYIILQQLGLGSFEAGIWSQVLLVGGLLGWLFTYAVRATGKKMTYHQQREQYEEAFFKKRLDELSPQELAQIQAELEQEQGSKRVGETGGYGENSDSVTPNS